VGPSNFLPSDIAWRAGQSRTYTSSYAFLPIDKRSHLDWRHSGTMPEEQRRTPSCAMLQYSASLQTKAKTSDLSGARRQAFWLLTIECGNV
jgi:hypothetical protein